MTETPEPSTPDYPPGDDTIAIPRAMLARVLGELQGNAASATICATLLTDNLSMFWWLPFYASGAVMKKQWPRLTPYQKRHLLIMITLTCEAHADRMKQYLLDDQLDSPLPEWTQADSEDIEQRAERIAAGAEEPEATTTDERSAEIPDAVPADDPFADTGAAERGPLADDDIRP